MEDDDLEPDVAAGIFRENLEYRASTNVLRIEINWRENNTFPSLETSPTEIIPYASEK